MNNSVNDNLERRINRLLDGELTDQERADLQRELLRNPAAGSLMGQYTRQDDLCRRAVETALETGAAEQPSFAAGAKARPGRARWIASLAAAAVLLAIGLWAGHQGEPQDTTPPPRVAAGTDGRPAAPQAGAFILNGSGPAAALEVPMQRIRTFDRLPVTIYDEQRNELRVFYVDREQARVRKVSMDL